VKLGVVSDNARWERDRNRDVMCATRLLEEEMAMASLNELCSHQASTSPEQVFVALPASILRCHIEHLFE
jgi:hypothetical protein